MTYPVLFGASAKDIFSAAKLLSQPPSGPGTPNLSKAQKWVSNW
jgi:hypothetical protein